MFRAYLTTCSLWIATHPFAVLAGPAERIASVNRYAKTQSNNAVSQYGVWVLVFFGVISLVSIFLMMRHQKQEKARRARRRKRRQASMR